MFSRIRNGGTITMKPFEMTHKKIINHTIVALTLFLLAGSTWAGTFSDNFNDGNMDGWTLFRPPFGPPNSTWKIENGELVLEAVDTPIVFLIGESTWKNYTVRVKAKMVKHQYDVDWAEGILLPIRFNPQLNLYLFGVGTTGSDVPISKDKRVFAGYGQDGSAALLHNEFEPFEWQLDTWYDLRLTAEGDEFKLYVNNTLVLDYTDNTHPTGSVGIGACCIRGTTVHYDDFSVTGDDVPGTVAAVDPRAKLATTWGAIKRSR